MGLFKRENKRKNQLAKKFGQFKAIRITEAAEIIGCSAHAIRTGLVGNFRLFKLNLEKKNSPFLMYESELNHYLEQRDKQI